MYKKVSTNLNFVEREKKTEKFWRDNDIFKKSMDSRKEGETYTFYDGPGKPRFFQACTKDGQKICQTRDIPEYSGDGFWCLAVLDIEISRNRALKSKQVRKKALDERDIQGFFCAIILWERKTYP